MEILTPLSKFPKIYIFPIKTSIVDKLPIVVSNPSKSEVPYGFIIIINYQRFYIFIMVVTFYLNNNVIK